MPEEVLWSIKVNKKNFIEQKIILEQDQGNVIIAFHNFLLYIDCHGLKIL